MTSVFPISTRVSVIIPSYNGGEKLAVTVDSILKNQSSGSDSIEIIVVDDGSPIPVKPFLDAYTISPPFSLSIIRQRNAGPAAARNTGFRTAHGEIVIFVDDDIICPNDLIQQHIAAHAAHPKRVVFGQCPYIKPARLTPFFKYVTSLYQPSNKIESEAFTAATIVASGHLSVERAMFDTERGIYDDTLVTPAAEEFELSQYLQKQNIPVFLANRISALHNQSLNLSTTCNQQYKHGLGCAEVAFKYPETRELKQLDDVIRMVGPLRSDDPLALKLKKRLLRAFENQQSRIAFLKFVGYVEQLIPIELLLRPLYHVAISAYFSAGVRDGFKRFVVKVP